MPARFPPRRHSTSQRVYEAIRQQPGTDRAKIAAALGIGWSTVKYHVQKLRRSKKIRTLEKDGRLALFPADLPTGTERALLALRRRNASRILEFLCDRKESNLKQLATRFDVSRKVIGRDLRNLVEVGLVERQGGHRGKYSVTKTGRKWIDHRDERDP